MFEVIRAEEEWQRAGAYSVRIQGMNRRYNISLREEFDEYDGEGTRYIILLDSGYPVATCRFYETACDRVTLGRVVVLPEYRGKGVGRMVLDEAEKWICSLGYRRIDIDSRITAVEFYRKAGFEIENEEVIQSGVFECIRMRKTLK